MQTFCVSQNARLYVECSAALEEAGIMLQMPERVCVQTTHEEVTALTDNMRSVSGTLLAGTRESIINKLKPVSDPRELSGKEKSDFDQDCFLLAMVKHITDGSPMILVTAPQQLGCAQCGAHARHTCSSCRLVRYCGSKCQKIHWKEHHKSECRARD